MCDERGTWSPDGESEIDAWVLYETWLSDHDAPEARRTPILRPLGMDRTEAWDFELRD